MKWIRERDELIAQTMAFVQSVTGRKEEILPTGIPPIQPPAPASPAQVSQVSTQMSATLTIETTTVEVTLPPQPAEAPQPVEAPKAFQVSPPRLTGDYRSEVLARVATFRKHQERFEREREEYCAETLAKLRASIREPLPRRPAGK